MPARRLLVAALLLLGLAVVTIEASYVHSDDGCVVETHCNACLLQLGTAGVLVVAMPAPPVLALVERLEAPATAEQDDVAPRGVLSRGPPLA
jgi:hypothetical protein